MTTFKTIRRATQESAQKAMDAHEKQMLEKGWKIGQRFAGNSGIRWEEIREFYK